MSSENIQCEHEIRISFLNVLREVDGRRASLEETLHSFARAENVSLQD